MLKRLLWIHNYVEGLVSYFQRPIYTGTMYLNFGIGLLKIVIRQG